MRTTEMPGWPSHAGGLCGGDCVRNRAWDNAAREATGRDRYRRFFCWENVTDPCSSLPGYAHAAQGLPLEEQPAFFSTCGSPTGSNAVRVVLVQPKGSSAAARWNMVPTERKLPRVRVSSAAILYLRRVEAAQQRRIRSFLSR